MTTLLLHKKNKLTLFDFTRRLSDDHPTVRALRLGLRQQASLVLRCGKLSFVVLAVFVFSLVYGLAGKKKRLSLRFCAHVATLISTRVSAHPFGAAFAAHKRRFNAWPIVHHDPRLAQPLFTTVGIRGSDSLR